MELSLHFPVILLDNFTFTFAVIQKTELEYELHSVANGVVYRMCTLLIINEAEEGGALMVSSTLLQAKVC
jgi:hypothetical protein